MNEFLFLYFSIGFLFYYYLITTIDIFDIFHGLNFTVNLYIFCWLFLIVFLLVGWPIFLVMFFLRLLKNKLT